MNKKTYVFSIIIKGTDFDDALEECRKMIPYPKVEGDTGHIVHTCMKGDWYEIIKREKKYIDFKEALENILKD